jgi:hypothetical protein
MGHDPEEERETDIITLAQEGMDAFNKGGKVEDCPYEKDSHEWKMWVAGFRSAEEALSAKRKG